LVSRKMVLKKPKEMEINRQCTDAILHDRELGSIDL